MSEKNKNHQRAVPPLSQASGADAPSESDSSQKPTSSTTNTSSQSPRKRSWLSYLCKFIIALLILIIIALAAFWIWSGRNGSLAQTISLVQRYVPIVQNSLQVEDVQGSLRHGGTIRSLRWQQDTIDAQLINIDLNWNLNALFSRTILIEHVTADTVQVNTLPQETPAEPKDASKLAPPPGDLRIPFFSADLNLLKVNTFIFGEKEGGLYVKDIQANYHYDRINHQLAVENLAFEQGRYQANVVLTALNPRLDAQLTAALENQVPGSDQQARVHAKADIKGLLTELHITADAQAAVLQATTESLTPENPSTSAPQTAHLNATVTPWNALILPQADLNLQDFNIGLFWPQAPQTLLTGTAHVTSSESVNSPIGALQVRANIKNTHAGVLDQQLLPVSELNVNATWDGDHATLEQLDVLVGDTGSITATGFIQLPVANSVATLPLVDISAKINDVNPRKILSTLGNDRINGSLTANHKAEGLFYNLSLKALDVTPDKAGTPKIQNIMARGSIIAETLALEELSIKTSNSNLKGQATYRLPIKLLATLASDEKVDIAQSFERGVANGNFDLNAPGITAHFSAKQLSASAGNFMLDLKAPQTQETLTWVQQLPLMPAVVHDYMSRGGFDLQAQAEGGWLNPLLDAKLTSLELIIAQRKAPETQTPKPSTQPQQNTPPDTQTASMDVLAPAPLPATALAPVASATTGVFTDLINIKDTVVTVNGRMSDATLTAQTNATIKPHILDLNLQAKGGFKNNILNVQFDHLESTLSQLQSQPSKGSPPNTIKTLLSVNLESPVDLSWNNNSELLTINPGSLKLMLAGKAEQAPSLAWDKSTWKAGVLDTSGSLTSFPALWLTSLVDSQLAGLDLGGDLMVEGNWKVHMGSTLDFVVEVARSSGDLTLESSASAFSSVASQYFQAGVREAYLKAYNEGNKINVELVWDSERASIININVATLLSKTDTFWTVAPDAPLSGHVIAQLPEIGIASTVAPTGWRFGGAAILDSELGGTIEAPIVQGRLSAMGVSLRSVIDGISFEDGKMEIIFDRNKVHMQELSLRGAGADGGSLKATGLVDWSKGELPTIELDLIIDKLKASIHSDRQLMTSGKITMSLKDKALNIIGNVLVDRALIIVGGSGAPALDDDVVILTGGEQLDTTEKVKKPNRLEALGIIPNIKISLDMGKNLRVQGFGLQTYLEGQLDLTNQGWNPILMGTINTAHGRFKAYGQHLIVEKGDILFQGAIDNPTLDILAIRANTSERVGIHVTGTAVHPNIKLYSASGMSDRETLSWLVLGRPSSADGNEMALLQQAALALISGEGGGITDQLAGALGVDEISFGGSKSGSSDDSMADATITIGKRLTEDFYVSYEQGLTGAMGTFYVFYDISKRLTLRGEAGEFTALDLIYTFRFDGKKDARKEED